MKKNILLTFITLGIVSLVSAQYQVDALRFSQNNYTGTARSIAMGNSLSAVGNDMSVLATNPAGIAAFENSQFSITQAFMMSSSTADFQGTSNADSRYDYAINNFGFVFAFSDPGNDWSNISFGLSYNRLNNYTQKLMIDGTNNTGSILDSYIYNANSDVEGLQRYNDGYGNRSSEYREGLAHSDSIILFDSNGYYSPVTERGDYGERQHKSVTRKGGAGEWDFTIGAAYKDIFYFGGTFGLTNVNFASDTYYKESDFVPVLNNGIELQPKSIRYNETLTTSGTGLNFKVGVLAQPVKFLRLGGSIHSSTFYSLSEEFETDMTTDFFSADNQGNYEYFAPLGGSNFSTFNYSLRTPFRATAGLAFLLDSYPIITGYHTMPMILSFGYEFVDYSKAKFTGDGDSFLDDNSAIASMYQATHNLNVGYEMSSPVKNKVRYKGRVGYSVYNSAALGSEFLKDARSEYSGGIGFEGQYLYLDLSYTVAQYKQVNYLYDATNYYPNNPMGYTDSGAAIPEPTSVITNMNHYLNITTGIKF